MISGIDINTLFLIGIGGLVSWSLKGITSINNKLGQLNGRLGKIETWREEHVKLDDERQKKIEKNMDGLWSKMK